MATARLERWHVDSVYGTMIWGDCYDDSSKVYKDGKRVVTWPINGGKELLVTVKEGDVVTSITNNTYILGKPYTEIIHKD